MNRKNSELLNHDERPISQHLKRWRTVLFVPMVTGFLLIALYALLNPQAFTTPVAYAAGSITGWYTEGGCPQLWPDLQDRGMNGWRISGESTRCWAYPNDTIRADQVTYEGLIHGIAFQVNSLVLGDRGLKFSYRNCGTGCGVPITATGTWLFYREDGVITPEIIALFDHAVSVNNEVITFHGFIFHGPFLGEPQAVVIDIGSIAIIDDGPLPPLPGYPPDGTLYPLLDPMVSNSGGECPICTGVNAKAYAGGPIDTHNGNLSYEETDLSIPVAGSALAFRRAYASGMVHAYTTTVGYGWTHNYEMRLHFSHTTLSDTVELQAPGGSRLPFFITYTNGLTTYIPYPGVTAALSYDANSAVYTVSSFNQHLYRFDSAGRLLEQEDPAGNLITFSYSSERLATAAQGGRSLAYGYDGNGRLISVTDHYNRQVQLGYDGNGDLAVVTDTLGLVTTYAYSGTTHLLTEVMDASGRIVEQTAYHGDGRAYRQWDGAGNLLVEIDYALAASDGVTRNVVIENGVVMTHSYDVRNTLVGMTYHCSGTPGCQTGMEANYDFNFKHEGIQDANGNPPTQLGWNEGGGTLAQNEGSSNLEYVQNALGQETFLQYDLHNNLVETTNARAYTTQYTYGHPDFPTFLTSMTDALGNVTIYTPTTSSDGVPPGLLKAERDANGRITTYQYNPYGQVTQQVVAAGTPEAITTTYGYDALGRLISTTQTSAAESHTSLNVYDAGDRLVATIANWTGSNPATWQNECAMPAPSADANVCTRYGYDAAGRPISSTNALGQTDLTFYDGAGRVVTSVVNYDGSTAFTALCTDFTNPDPEYNLCALTGYDGYGRVVTSTDSLGRQTVTEYDSLGRVSGSIVNWVDGLFNALEPDRDLITAYSYDAVGNVLVVTDPAGRQSRTFYDALNRVSGTIENWDGSATLADCASLPRERDENICTQYQYDEVGNTVMVTNTLTQTSRTFYDALNRVVATVENWQPGFTSPSQCQLAPNNTADQNICTLYGYDDAGNQVTTTNALNQTTLTVYDAANRPFLTVANWDGSTVFDEAADCQFPPAQPDVNVCTLTTYDALGRPVSAKDPLGHLTAYAYDGLGRVVTTTQYLDGVPVTSHTTYDALGNRLASTDAAGHTTSYAYDSLNRLVQTTTAEGVITTQTTNAAGWVLTATDGLGNDTAIGYDLLGRRTSVTDAEGNVTTYKYDALGNQIVMIDAAGVRTGYDYDGLNRLVEVIENEVVAGSQTAEQNVLTQYRYDALGNRTVITNALGLTTTHTLYDALNRPVTVRDALGNATHTGYNALGLRTVMTDGNGALTTYAYDNLNRLRTTTYQADAETVVYTYDAAGSRLTMTDNVGVTTYQYDDLYRLLTVTNPFNAVVGYRYDLVGNRTSLIYPDGRTITTTYDLDNRLIQVQDWDSGLTTYGYDAAGRLVTAVLPNGIATFYTYDAANRLTQLQHVDSGSGDTIARFEYTLDAVGNRTAVSETLRLPQTPGGQAALPAGVVRGDEAPATAAAVWAAIQPPPISLDKERLARPAVPAPRLQGPPPQPPQTFTTTQPLPLAADLPFDAAEVMERARNQLETVPGGRAAIQRPGHAAAFAASGELTFVPVLSDTGPLTLTLEPAVPLTVAVRLAAVRQGSHNLPITPAPGQREIAENVISQPRGPWLVEEFVARDGGIEQRWRLDSPPPHSGDLTLAVDATTALLLTVDEDGFVFHAPTTDGQTLPLMRYGRALAIDANGAEQWAALSFTQLPAAPDGRHRYRLRMTISATWLATAHYPLLIDPLLSNLVRLEQAAPANNQNTPEVAYNPDEDEFLLVWRDYRNGNWDIYGQRVNGDGALLDENFIVTNASYEQSHPRLAYGDGVYLVIWRHYPPTTYYDVRGAIISGTGEIVANSLPIATNNSKYEHVNDVVFNSTSNEFLVLWQERGTYWDVWGRHVAADGSMGSAFQVTSQANWHEENTAAAYNPEDDEYLVVWRRNAGGSTQLVEGQRLDGDGTLLGPVIDIGDGGGQERDPDVIYLAGADRYVAVWRDNRHSGSSSWDIYGQLLETDGTLDGSNFVIAAAAVEETTPRLAVDANSGGALVVWRHNAGGSAGYDLYGRLLDSQGEVAGSSFAVQAENGNQELPVLAQNSAGDFLVAWHDNRHGSQDIFTRLRLADGSWGGAGMAHPAPGDQEKPQIAYNPDDDEYLVVWQDYRSSTDWNIYGQRVAGDGSLIGQNIAIDTTGTRHQTNPHVAYGADEYLVTWQHYTDNNNTTYDVYGRIIARSGSFVTSAFVIANSTDSKGKALLDVPNDVVYNSGSNQFLVLWQVEAGTGNWDIAGRHVSPTGATGSTIAIAAAAGAERDAAGAYNADDDQYLVVWDTPSGQFDAVYGRRLTGGGTVITTDAIAISTQADVASVADLVYLPGTGQYYAVWMKGNFGFQNGDVQGRAIMPNGSTGSTVSLAATNRDERQPRLAVDSTGALLVWQKSNVSSGYDLYGRALDASGQPSGDPFTIQETAGNQQNPAVAYGSNQRTQLAWQDDREGSWDLYTASLDRRYQVTHIQYDYDPLYRVTNASYSGDLSASYAYTYDAVGNMTAYTEAVGVQTSIVNRTFDAANQLQTATDTELGTTSFYYDGNGRLVDILPPGVVVEGEGAIRYRFNQRDLLVAQETFMEAEGDWVLQAEFVYDGDANRVQQIDYTGVTPITTTYTNDVVGLSQVLVSSNGVTTTHNLFGLDLIHVDDGSATRTVLGDGLGSGRVEMVGSAVETATTYEPYGKVLAQSGASGTVYGFTGEQYDILTSLVYLRARYYSPALKIFLSRDPFPGWARTPASQHGYSYVHNNPVNLTDPSGMVIETPLDIAFIIYDIFQLGYDIYKVHTTTGKEQQMYRQQLGVDVAATALDVLMLFIPGGTGGGMAYRGVAAAGSRGVINVSTDAIRVAGVLDDLVRTVGRGTQWLVKALQSSPLLCITSGGSGGSGSSGSGGSGSRGTSNASGGPPKIENIADPNNPPKRIDWIPGHDEIAKDAREALIDDYLESIGRKQERNPLQNASGRRPDRLGIEYKSIGPWGDSNRIQHSVNSSLSGTGQARHIIVDVRASGMSLNEATRGISRSFGLQRAHKLDVIEIIGDGFHLVGTKP